VASLGMSGGFFALRIHLGTLIMGFFVDASHIGTCFRFAYHKK
jgi:hypothetical protein